MLIVPEPANTDAELGAVVLVFNGWKVCLMGWDPLYQNKYDVKNTSGGCLQWNKADIQSKKVLPKDKW